MANRTLDLFAEDKPRGVNISTRSNDPLGRALTNPVWGSKKDGKNYYDVETEYKKWQSKKTRPDLPFDEALRFDLTSPHG